MPSRWGFAPIARPGRRWQSAVVATVLIRLQRPASLTSEMRAWISQRLGAGYAGLALGKLQRSELGDLVLRVYVREESVASADQDLADLMMDMRLLGLRPSLVGDTSGVAHSQPNR